jgi:hypothetical protein
MKKAPGYVPGFLFAECLDVADSEVAGPADSHAGRPESETISD